MKYLSEYRDPSLARALIGQIRQTASRRWTLMEYAAGRLTIVKQGLDELLGESVEMIHGPGCPVCVTPLEQIDRALALAAMPNVVFTSFGDMLGCRAASATCSRSGPVVVRSRWCTRRSMRWPSPERTLIVKWSFRGRLRDDGPGKRHGCLACRTAGNPKFQHAGLHVTVPPAMTAILDAPDNRVQGFLAAGHVCTVMGWTEYEPIAARYRVPIIVTGFEPLDILEGIYLGVRQLEAGRYEVENQYVRSVRREGTVPARTSSSGSSTWWIGSGAARHHPHEWIGSSRRVRGLRCRASLRAQ
jgi:hydrogenase expression/formation protein HypD